MFGLVRKFLGGASDDSAANTPAALISIPSGQLYLKRPRHSSKVQKECIYLEADLTIRRTGVPFHYEMIVSRIPTGDEDPSASEDDQEKAFLLNESLGFSVDVVVDDSDEDENNAIAFSWFDVSSPEMSDRFEFVINSQSEGCSGPEIYQVESIIYQCIWEDKNEKDSTDAPEEELVALKQQSPAQPQTSHVTHVSPSRVFRPPSLDSDDSETEKSGNEMIGPEDHSDENAEQDDESDSSADEIVQQLKGTSLSRVPEVGQQQVPLSSRQPETPLRTQNAPASHQFSPSVSRPTNFESSSVRDALQQKQGTPLKPPSSSISSPSMSSLSRGPDQYQRQETPLRSREGPPEFQSPPYSSSTVSGASISSASSAQYYNQRDLSSPRPSTETPLRSQIATSSTTGSPQVLPQQGDYSQVKYSPQVKPQSLGTGHVASPGPSPRPANHQQEAPAEKKPPFALQPVAPPSLNDAVPFWESTCDLFAFDSNAAGFRPTNRNVMARLWISAPHNPQRDICWLLVTDEQVDNHPTFLVADVAGESKLMFAQKWIHIEQPYTDPQTNESYPRAFALQFKEPGISHENRVALQVMITKISHDRAEGPGSYEAQDLDSQRWSRLKYSMDNGADHVDTDEPDRSVETEETDETEGSEEDVTSSDEEDNAELRRFNSKGKGPKNSLLAVGYKEDMSAVSRGNMLGIFSNDSGGSGKPKFMGSITDICTPDGKRSIIPSKMMLHYQDSSMVLGDSQNPTSLYKLDMMVGKVVEEWDVGGNTPVSNFLPRTKFSQMNPEATFLGTSHNSIYAIDPRLSGRKAVSNESKSYKTKVDFSCAATTESGQIIVGSREGVVRLYDPLIGRNAKSVITTFYEPSVEVDVSKDGKWAIITCEKYLLFLDCQLDPNSGTTGFQKSFPKAHKPAARKIELTPEHRAFFNSQKMPFRFKSAKFNTGPDAVEKSIVTSVGPYIIAFDLKKLKAGQTEYTIKRYEESVVAENFRWDNDKDIVVTLESDVILEKRKKLSKPNRQSLIGTFPVRSPRAIGNLRAGSSSSGVVQEWDY